MLTSHKSHSWTKQSRKQLPHGLVRSRHLSLGCHLKVATIEVIHWLLPKQRLPHSSESLLYQMEESNNFGVHLPFHWNCVHFFATSKAGEQHLMLMLRQHYQSLYILTLISVVISIKSDQETLKSKLIQLKQTRQEILITLQVSIVSSEFYAKFSVN